VCADFFFVSSAMYTRTVAEVKELASHDAILTPAENLRWPAEYVRRELAAKPCVKKI
jgi:hypothetical protein